MRRYRNAEDATQLGEVFQNCESVITLTRHHSLQYYRIDKTISTVPLYCTSHPVHVRPSRRPLSCPSLPGEEADRSSSPHTSTNTKNTSNINRVQTRVHKSCDDSHKTRRIQTLRALFPLKDLPPPSPWTLSPRNKKPNPPPT